MNVIIDNTISLPPLTNQKPKMLTRNQLAVMSTIKSYLYSFDNITGCRCSNCKIGKINELYVYMLTNKTKQTLLLPIFSTFRVSVLKKTHEFSDELLILDDNKKEKGCKSYRMELLESLNQMKSFLEGEKNGTATVTEYIAKSPTKKVNNQVLLRRSARLMSKYA